MTMCFVCELDHGDGMCPDCTANQAWADQRAKAATWNRKGRAPKEASK